MAEPLTGFPPAQLDAMWRLYEERARATDEMMAIFRQHRRPPRPGREAFDSRFPFQGNPWPGQWSAFDSAKSQRPFDLLDWEDEIRTSRVGYGQAALVTVVRTEVRSQQERFWFSLRVPPLEGPNPEQVRWINERPKFYLWVRERFPDIEVDHDDERRTGSIIESQRHSVRRSSEAWGVQVVFPPLPTARLALRLAWTDTIGVPIWGGVSHATKMVR
jgi:hypothetical protein